MKTSPSEATLYVIANMKPTKSSLKRPLKNCSPGENATHALDEFYKHITGEGFSHVGLGIKVRNAHPRSVLLYAQIVCDHVERLNELIPTHREYLKSLSRKRVTWPILKSPHPYLSQNEKQVFIELDIGKSIGVPINSHCKWKLEGSIAELVEELRAWVGACKKKGKQSFSWRGRIHTLSSLEYLYYSEPEFCPHPVISNLREHLSRFETSAAKLADLSCDSVECWVKLTTNVIEECFDDPHCATFLSRTFVTAKSRKQQSGYGLAKQNLIGRIRKRLESLAGKSV
jgi:hypothetical protein